MAVGEDVYCTLVLNDAYLPGAAVLAHSLRDAGTTKKLAALVTLETLRYDTLTELQALFDYVIPVDRVANPNPANLYLIDRGDLLYAFTKINLWRLTEFRKVVYVDSDVVALRAPDELFETKETFAAASDIGWPDLFNSGVMVLNPDMGTYWALQTLAASGDSFDGADQGLLNQYFEHKNWRRLPFTYNCTPSASYQYEPAYRYHKSQVTMVHFIGQGKPWQKGRSNKGFGAYQELLSRWWAVYDRHYKFPVPGRQYAPTSGVVQSFVKGGAQPNGIVQQPHPQPLGVSEAPAITVEAPPTDQADRAEEIAQEHIGPTPTAEQRRFSAPYNEWDATRAPPPATSHPEAANFPTQNYEFNADPTPFQPPQSYPEPPKDLWYQVPKEKPLPPAARPKPLFPWEERPVTRPTRVFADDKFQTPSATSEADTSASHASTEDESGPKTPTTPTIKVTDEHPQTMEPIARNAWDDVAGIDAYVRELSQFQKLRGKLQVLHNQPRQAMSPSNEIDNPMEGSAVEEGDAETAATSGQPRERRESLILTDFPSAVERPSLPVTPAPIRRNLFWGEERDATGKLPEADGVPNQTEWNPSAKLEQLRQASLSLHPSQLVLPAKNVPRRDMPRSSIDVGVHPGLVLGDESMQTAHKGAHVRFPEQVVSAIKELPETEAAPDVGGVRFGQVKFGENAMVGEEGKISPMGEAVAS